MQEAENTTKEAAIDGNNMLCAFDLRLGNILLIDNEKHHPEIKNIPMVVKSISRNYWQGEGYILYCELDKLSPEKYDWKNYSQTIKFLKPIEITKEWLIRLGFIIDKENIIYIDAFPEGTPSQRFTIEFVNDKILLISRYQTWNDNFIIRHIKYIHQVQNLFYAVTGRELICT